MSDPRQPILITGGRVLDLDGDLDQPEPLDLLIEDGRIVAIGNDAQLARRSTAITTVDARGKLIIPGLINAHYHSHDVMLRGLFEQLPLDAWQLYSAPHNYERPSDDDIALRTRLGAADCLLNGITTVQDMVSIVDADRGHLDSIQRSYSESGIRVVLALQYSDRAAVDCVPFWRDLPEAIKTQLPDATDTTALQALISERVASHTDRLHWALGPSAPQRCSDALLRWTADLSRQHQLQVFTHVYEAKSQAVLARMDYPEGSLVTHLDAVGLLNQRLTIAHGVWISPSEIERFGAARASLACNPISNMKLLNGFAPVVDYAQSGANIGLGCDNCSGNDAQNIFQSMKMFALFWGLYSQAGDTGAAREAFKAVTLGGARAMGLSDELGLLRPGYRADLVMIDLDDASYRPLNSAVRQLVYSESGRGVHTVLVDGRVVVAGGKLQTMSEATLKAEAEIARERLLPDTRQLQIKNERFLADILSAYEKADRYPLEFDRRLMRRQP